MSNSIPVLVPLVNPNENESVLAQLLIKEGQLVKPGDAIAVFETTKSTFELIAEAGGYAAGIFAEVGDLLKAGETLCVLADQPGQKIEIKKPAKSEFTNTELPGDFRITKPALEFAKAHGVDLSSFPKHVLITEAMLKAQMTSTSAAIDPSKLIIYGGGGHAKSLIDLIRAEGKYTITGILDDGLPAGSLVLDVPVLGGGDKLAELRQQGIGQAINAVGGIGNITPRLKVYERLQEAGFSCPTVIHPRAFVEPTAKVSEGCQIFFNAYVGSAAQISFGCIVNTGAILSHDCVLENYVNISPGAILAGGVAIGERTLVGMGVTINLNVTVGAGARIGNSAVVKADVPENGIVRAGTVWPAD